MAYIKTEWVDGENKYSITDQAGKVIPGFENIKLIYTGTGGTPLSQEKMNNIEEGIFNHLADNSGHGGYIAYPGSTADGTDASTYDWLTGYYNIGPNMAGMPVASSFWMAQAYKNGSSNCVLISYRTTDKISYYIRVKVGGVWGTWYKFLTSKHFATLAELTAGTSQELVISPGRLRETSKCTTKASDNLRVSNDTESDTNSLTYVKKKVFSIKADGVYRVSFGIRTGNTNTSARGRIYKNGVALGTEQINGTTSFVTYSEDLAFSTGDTCELWIRSGSTSITTHSNNFRLSFDITREIVLDTTPDLPVSTYNEA